MRRSQLFISFILFTSFLHGQERAFKRIDHEVALSQQLKEQRAFQSSYVHLQKADSLIALQAAYPPLEIAAVKFLRGTLEYNLGYYHKAAESLNEARYIYRTFNRPGKEADCLLWIGSALWYPDGTDTALVYFEKALQKVEKDTGNERLYRGKYLAEKGHALLYKGQLREGKKCIEEALHLDTIHWGLHHQRSAETLQILATYHQFNEDPYQAIAVSQQIEVIYDRIYNNPNQIEFGILYANMSNLFFDLSQLSKALDYTHKALAIFAHHLPNNHTNILTLYTSLGDIYQNLEDFDKSIYYYEKAEEHNPQNDIFLDVMIAVGKALNYESEESYEAAISSLQEILPTVEKHYGGAKDLAWVYELLGENYKELGEFSRSRFYYKKAIDIYRSSLGGQHPAIARVYARLALNYVDEGALDSSIYYTNLGLEISWNKHQDFSKISDPDIWAILVHLKARTAVLANPKAVVNLQLGVEWYELVDRYFDYLHSKLELDADKNNLAEKIKKTHANLIQLYHRLADDQPSLAEKAFRLSEKNKSYLLLEAVKKTKIPYLDDYLQQVRYIQKQQNFYKIKIHEAELDPASNESAIHDWQARIFDSNRALVELKEKLPSQDKALFETAQNDHYLNIKGIQQQILRPQQTMLEYFVDNTFIYAFIIKKNSYEVVEIERDSSLVAHIHQLRKSISSPHAYNLPTYTTAAYQLYEVLIAPIEDRLTNELIIIPDDLLSYIPFEALLTAKPMDSNNPKNYPYLLHQYKISYSYSANLLWEMQNNKNEGMSQKELLALAPFSKDVTYYSTLNNRSFSPLPYISRSVDSLGQFFQIDAYYGAQASKELFTKTANEYRLLHLATHGQADERVGDYSFLVFMPKKNSQEPEYLYVRDLYTLQLQAELVFLSACETGVGELQTGEGIISLARGFAYAGAKSIITTLWEAYDQSTQALSILFYRYLASGLTKDAALREAKLAYLTQNSGRQTHPAYWAGLIGIGSMQRLN